MGMRLRVMGGCDGATGPLLPAASPSAGAGPSPGTWGHAAPVTHLTLWLSALPSALECLRFLGRPGPRRAGLRELSSRLQPRQEQGQPEPRGSHSPCPCAEPG